MKLGIVTDSTADLPAYLIEQYEIQFVLTVLILEGKEYKDGSGISREEFYTRLPSLHTPASTAAPSIGDFLSPYHSLLDSGCDHILYIHVSGKLSGVVNVARRAAQDFPGKVTCVDSGSLSMGIGFQVLAPVEAADLGVKAALDAVEQTKQRSKVFAALDTMEYLKRSGRIPAVVANIGGMLSIKPVVVQRLDSFHGSDPEPEPKGYRFGGITSHRRLGRYRTTVEQKKEGGEGIASATRTTSGWGIGWQPATPEIRDGGLLCRQESPCGVSPSGCQSTGPHVRASGPACAAVQISWRCCGGGTCFRRHKSPALPRRTARPPTHLHPKLPRCERTPSGEDCSRRRLSN